jgi:hypothetical protein
LDLQVTSLAVDPPGERGQQGNDQPVQRAVTRRIFPRRAAVLPDEHSAQQLDAAVLGHDPLLDHPPVLLACERNDRPARATACATGKASSRPNGC